MKSPSLLALFAIGFYLILANFPSVSSAKQGVTSRPDRNDRALASTIRQLTNRSTEGLVEKRRPGNGGTDLDLQGRFSEVPLVKVDSEGDPAVMCVASLEEANHFFGRDLETGEALPNDDLEAEYLAAKRAARSNMTEQEFLFYKGMAESNLTASANAANIVIVNGDGAGEGFNDLTAAVPEGGNAGTTLGQQRLNLFNHAASIWGAFLDSTVPISVNAKFDPLTPCSSSGGVLGSAGSASFSKDFPGAEIPATYYPVALRNKIVGSDANTSVAEINATFNSSIDTGCLGAGTRFYYGLDNTTPSMRVNLLVVLLHELGHGLGFLTIANGSTGALGGGFNDVYTRYMFDRLTSKYWGDMTNAERQASALNDGNLMFAGPNVRSASSILTAGRDSITGNVQLFAPTTLQSGSSLSHYDKAAFPNLLMEPAINAGLPLNLDLTRQLMRDIGWFRDSNGDRIPDTITNVSVGGANLTTGSVTSVTWTNTPGFNQNVMIELSLDGGITYPTIIASNVPNTGSYVFTVPEISTTKARIRVREYNFNAPSGVSGSDITIAPAAQNVDITGQVLSPGGLGLRNAVVSLTDNTGTRISTSTSSLGYFSFTGIPVGENITLQVYSRRYRFDPRSVVTSSTLGQISFTGME